MRAALAPAKLNLSLRVTTPAADGYHPLDSLVVAVDWYDHVRIAPSETDRLDVTGEPAPDGDDNLVWKALRYLRTSSDTRRPVHIELSKRIPAGSGLGGGSSDAAATIVAAADLFGIALPAPEGLAEIGADVPFFFTGGLARMTGRGETIAPVDRTSDYALAVVVPPLELSTAAVYRQWDAMNEPEGEALPFRDVPPALRGLGPLQNDLWPAALSLAPEMGDWRSELVQAWGTAVAMSGSGSALFGFFGDSVEAQEALHAAEVPFRARRAVVPVAHGARLDPRYTPERR